MRVLHVVEATLGGVRRYLEDILRTCYPADDCSFGIAYSNARSDAQFPELLAKMKAAGWETFEITMTRQIAPSRDLTAFRAVRSAIREFQPHVVHCHSSKSGAIGRIAARSLPQLRASTVYSPHALATYLGPQYKAIEWLVGKAATDAAIAVSASERQEIIRNGVVPPDRVFVVWPCVDAAVYSPRDRWAARAELGVDPSATILLGIGRLSRQKDPHTFVRLVARVAQDAPGIRGVWVGDGELRNSTEELAADLGAQSSIDVLGWQHDVRPWMAASDVMINTSRYESFGYGTAEAMAMGIPTVATRVTGTVDIVQPGATGELFEAGDDAAGAAVVRGLLASDDARAKIARRGRDFVVRSFNGNEMRGNLMRAYESARQRRSSVLAPTRARIGTLTSARHSVR